MPDTITDMVVYIDDLIREAMPARDAIQDTLTRSKRRYTGQHWETEPQAGLKQYVINVTKRAIVGSTAVQTEQRPRVMFEPVETNEPPIVYLAASASGKIQEYASEYGLTPLQVSGKEPIDLSVVFSLQNIVKAVEQPPDYVENDINDTADGIEHTITAESAQPMYEPIFTEEDFVIITDDTAAKAMQRTFDVLWDRSDADAAWMQNIMNKEIFGYQPMLIQWSEQDNKIVHYNIHHLHIHVSPESTGVHDSDYVILEEPMSDDKALALYPEWSDVISRYATSGSISSRFSDYSNNSLSAAYRSTNFARKMIVLKTAWLRNQDVPVSEFDAEMHGLTPALNEDGTVVMADGRVMYVDPSGSLTYYGSDNWPVKPGIRQVRIIEDTVVEDIECPYVDIPIVWNICLPKPFSPFGSGTAENLYDLQDDINRVVSILHNHLKYYQSPQEWWPESLSKANKGAATHSHAGRRTIVPDDVYREFIGNTGRNGFSVDPPNLPASYVDYLRILIDIADKESDHSSILQGHVPSGIESGRAIDLLQTAAKGTIALKSIFTEFAVKHYARLVCGMIMDFMPESEWVRINSGYPNHILLAMRNRAKMMEYDIKAEIVSGKGMSRRMAQQLAMDQFGAGLRGPRSTMQALEIPNINEEIEDIISNPISPLGQRMARQVGDTSVSESGSQQATQ